MLRAILNRIELLPKLGFSKFKDVIDYLKTGDQEEQAHLEQELKALGVNVVYEASTQKLKALVREEVRRVLTNKK